MTEQQAMQHRPFSPPCSPRKRAGVLAVLGLTVSCAMLAATALPAGSAEGKNSQGTRSEAIIRRSQERRARRLARPPTTASPLASPAAIPLPPAHVRIPILVYHHVRPQQGWSLETWSWKMTVSPDVFERQMQWLIDRGYTTVSLDTLTQILRGERAGPMKPVVVTFDDNNMNAFDSAFPVLARNGQIAVFYLIANRLDNPAFIGRAQVPALLAAGMDIQSHTVTHAALTNLPMGKMDAELSESRRILEELTGKPVRHLAYPLTMQNATVRDRAKAAGYQTATIMDPREVTEKDDWLKLPRIMMTDATDLASLLP